MWTVTTRHTRLLPILMTNRINLFIIFLWGVFFVSIPALTSATINPFPVYPCIRANVNFWKIVYSKYSSRHGLIHDSDNLAVIYEVVDLQDPQIPGSSRANSKIIKRAEKKYRRILQELAAGHPATSATEKKILAMFGGRPSRKVLREASYNVRFQLCLKDRFCKGVVNSGRYLPEIKKIFLKRHLPTDLAYLPHVESSFNYEAYSKFGAAGIWQFIRSTGRRFLTISYTVDERRDPLMATKAAAEYLQENYEKLQSWPLAITAYNHGAASMLRAQKKLGNYEEIIKKYQNKRFGFASKNFYPEFLAAREIAKHYKKYFPYLKMKAPVITDKISLKGYADIEDLAEILNLEINKIKALNPALRRPVFSGQKYIPKNYHLRLPKKVARQAHIPPDIYKKNQKRSRFYRVARGDTAGKIAKMQRVSLRDLLDFNQLGRRAVIYVGQNLRIPVPGERRLASLTPAVPPPPEHTAAKQDENKPTATPTLAAAQEKTRPARPAQNHSVLAGVSEKITNGLSEKKAYAAVPVTQSSNSKLAINLPPDKTKEPATELAPAPPQTKGEEVAMLQSHSTDWSDAGAAMLADHGLETESEQPAIDPQPQNMVDVNPEVVVGNFQIEKTFKEKGKEIGLVKVEESETLGHYADWLNVPTQTIRDLNNLPFHRQIRTHQEIKIPLVKVDKDTFEERRYEFHKEMEEDFFTAYKVTGVQSYTIKRGDNIWTICHDKLDLPFWLIKKYNPGMAFSNLQPRQRLLFPAVQDSQNPEDSPPKTVASSAVQTPTG